jgi:predicted DCC family thiol-disulfide oxidoreductase YuxK
MIPGRVTKKGHPDDEVVKGFIDDRSAAREAGGFVLFDGTCAFCEGSAKFIARRDPSRYFRFGASQSPQAATLLARHGLARDTARSLILIEDGRAYLRSTASLRIAARLTFPWSLLRACLLVPRPLRDGIYRSVAALRHRLAGSSDACEIPPPEIRSRMI